MTGSLTIGRCAALSSWRTLSIDGDSHTVTAQLKAPTEAEYQARCFALSGYPNPDEPWTPVVTTGRTYGLTGLWSIESVSIERGSTDAALLADVTITMSRPPGFASPLAELSHFGFLRSNTQSWTSGNEAYGFGFPDAVTEVSGYPSGGTWATLTGDDGDVLLWYDKVAGFDADLLYGIDPADWYLSSARIEQKLGGGSDWVQLPGHACENLPYSTRIGNDLARLTLSVASGPTLNLNTEHFDGSQWETAKDWQLSDAGTFGTIEGASAPVVILNTPATCIVRFALIASDPTDGRALLDVKVRRGIRNIECTLRSSSSVSDWTVERATLETGQAIPGGIAAGVRANANDGDGNRYLLISPDAHTRDTVQGGIDQTTPGDTFRFILSSEIGGSGASAPSDYATLRQLAFGGVAESPVGVVSR